MQPDSALGQERRRARSTTHPGPAGRLRVAVVAESFLPSSNPVTTSVCRTLEHLSRRGHDAVVICPGPAPESFAGATVISAATLPLGRNRIGLPSPRVLRTLAAFAPDIVHLAAPLVLGSAGVEAARQLGVPSVAVHPGAATGSAERTGLSRILGTPRLSRYWVRRIHQQADLSLAPAGLDLTIGWPPGTAGPTRWQPLVDLDLFTPRRRDTPAVAALRARLAPGNEVLVGVLAAGLPGAPFPGAVGWSAPAVLADLPGVRVVEIGTGAAAADMYAALDIFVQTGFRQDDTGAGPDPSRSEAMASGVPVVARAGLESGAAIAPVAPGLNGLVYPAGDAVALRAAVLDLAGDPDQRRWMGTAARVGVERQTWEILGDELIAHYRAVLERRAVTV